MSVTSSHVRRDPMVARGKHGEDAVRRDEPEPQRVLVERDERQPARHEPGGHGRAAVQGADPDRHLEARMARLAAESEFLG